MSSEYENIRRSIISRWQETLSRHGNLSSSDSVSGSSPPSVFVGSYGYPKVQVGPMVPPVHGDTSLLDSPERWGAKSLEEIVNFRLNLVRGVRTVRADRVDGSYIENLQEVAMSSRPADSDLVFQKNALPTVSLDGQSAPFGPVGRIKSAKFSAGSSVIPIQKAYYDRDLTAQDAVLNLYNSGIEISKIQKCFSIGMLGRGRRLVPTRWSITATDDIICKSLTKDVLNYDLIDSYRVFSYLHLGNIFSIVLFPHRWVYEMIEAWYSGGILAFGSDCEDARGIDHPPAIAGAYFAAKLGVLEYLKRNKIQAGAVILREIRPEYAVPVGVWQVREGVRSAMLGAPVMAEGFDDALSLASAMTGVGKSEWLLHGDISQLVRQKTISDFL